jgi:hypothetical protein
MIHTLIFDIWPSSHSTGCIGIVNIKVSLVFWNYVTMEIFTKFTRRLTAIPLSLSNKQGYDLYKHFDRLMSKHLAIIFLHCMPMKIKAFHLLTGSADGVMSLILPSMKQVVGKECRLRMKVHSGNDDKMLESLKPYGLTSRHLSDTLGGEFKYDDFVEWLERWKGTHERKDFSISSTQPDEFSDSE